MRPCGVGGFAFFCTVVDAFETFSGVQAWDTYAEFVDDFDGTDAECGRYIELMPDWVRLEPHGAQPQGVDAKSWYYQRTEGGDDGRTVYRRISTVPGVEGWAFLRLERAVDALAVCAALNAAESRRAARRIAGQANENGGRQMKEYVSHKRVQAMKIASIIHGRGATLADAAGVSVEVSRAYVEKHEPRVGGYYVLYGDGYESWSPAAAFESGYTEVTRSDVEGA